MLLTWCAQVARTPRLELIFRPRPIVAEEQMKTFAAAVPGIADSNIRFIKRHSVRDWILASDVVVSSYSTSLIEAALAGKPGFMVAPITLPPALACDWHKYALSVTSLDDFTSACRELTEPSAALAAWARNEMLSRGDPIQGLAARIADLARQAQRSARPTEAIEIARRKRLEFPPQAFNLEAHDQDVFEQPFIENRLRAWTRVLDGHC